MRHAIAKNSPEFLQKRARGAAIMQFMLRLLFINVLVFFLGISLPLACDQFCLTNRAFLSGISIGSPSALLPLAMYLCPLGIAFFLGMRGLGMHSLTAFVIFVAAVAASSINIPLGHVSHGVPAQLVHADFFSYVQPWHTSATELAVNLGGAVLPLLGCVWMLRVARIWPAVLATLAAAVAAYVASSAVPGEMILIDPILPALAAAVVALALAREQAARIAFAAGVLGTLIGGDFFNFAWVLQQDVQSLSIGGGGLADAVFVSGVFAAFLAGVRRQGKMPALATQAVVAAA